MAVLTILPGSGMKAYLTWKFLTYFTPPFEPANAAFPILQLRSGYPSLARVQTSSYIMKQSDH